MNIKGDNSRGMKPGNLTIIFMQQTKREILINPKKAQRVSTRMKIDRKSLNEIKFLILDPSDNPEMVL
jgi:hypothetical protein